MEIKQLLYFVAVAEAGSYLRAAKRLNVSQPALSISIKNLEAEVGAPLFFPFGQKRKLTDEGNSLYADAKDLLTVYQRALDNVKDTSKNIRGTIRFGLPPLMGACFFGTMFPEFSKAYPDIKISIIEEGAIRVDQMVEDGSLDMALSLNTDRTSEFERHHFTTQRNVVLLNCAHPLANRTTLTIADLQDEPFAVFNENFILHKQILAACREAGFFPKFSLLTSQWDFMVEMVSQNQGISILPKPVYENSAKKSVVAIPLVGSMKYWDIEIIWKKNRYFSKPCKAFFEHICNHLPADDIDDE